jgi:hypothetical protein
MHALLPATVSAWIIGFSGGQRVATRSGQTARTRGACSYFLLFLLLVGAASVATRMMQSFYSTT